MISPSAGRSRNASVRNSQPSRAAGRTGGEHSRERILDAAERLLADRGYAGSGISLISRDSGLPASSIYWFFDSKQELVLAVIERAAERFFEEIEPRTRQPEQAFESLLQRALEQNGQRLPVFLRLAILMSLELGDRHPEVRTRLVRIRERAREQMVWALERSLAPVVPDAGELAQQLGAFALATAEGVCIANELEPGHIDLDVATHDLHTALVAIARSRIERTPA